MVIAGRPNAGKSSLLNMLAERDVAIVTDIAGTTRDLIAVDLDLGGYKVTLIDTAGLRPTDDRVEAEGIRRALRSAEQADLVLMLRDCRDSAEFEPVKGSAAILRVATKVDMLEGDEDAGSSDLAVSVVTGQGIDSLVKRILVEVEQAVGSAGGLHVVRARQLDLLREVGEVLALSLESSASLEFRAEYLRQAGQILGRLTGFVDTEALLGVIFSEFCIGK